MTTLDEINKNYRPHPDGNRNLFGLNSFGTNSIILYTEVDGASDIWHFKYFKSGTTSVRDAIYTNASGIIRKFDLLDENIASRTTRMEKC
jgi:hypothetical protein